MAAGDEPPRKLPASRCAHNSCSKFALNFVSLAQARSRKQRSSSGDFWSIASKKRDFTSGRTSFIDELLTTLYLSMPRSKTDCTENLQIFRRIPAGVRENQPEAYFSSRSRA